jgi:hypothetical protein
VRSRLTSGCPGRPRERRALGRESDPEGIPGLSREVARAETSPGRMPCRGLATTFVARRGQDCRGVWKGSRDTLCRSATTSATTKSAVRDGLGGDHFPVRRDESDVFRRNYRCGFGPVSVRVDGVDSPSGAGFGRWRKTECGSRRKSSDLRGRRPRARPGTGRTVGAPVVHASPPGPRRGRWAAGPTRTRDSRRRSFVAPRRSLECGARPTARTPRLGREVRTRPRAARVVHASPACLPDGPAPPSPSISRVSVARRAVTTSSQAWHGPPCGVRGVRGRSSAPGRPDPRRSPARLGSSSDDRWREGGPRGRTESTGSRPSRAVRRHRPRAIASPSARAGEFGRGLGVADARNVGVDLPAGEHLLHPIARRRRRPVQPPAPCGTIPGRQSLERVMNSSGKVAPPCGASGG